MAQNQQYLGEKKGQ